MADSAARARGSRSQVSIERDEEILPTAFDRPERNTAATAARKLDLSTPNPENRGNPFREMNKNNSSTQFLVSRSVFFSTISFCVLLLLLLTMGRQLGAAELKEARV